MYGGERTLRPWWEEKHLEGEISIKCRHSKNSKKEEWKPFHVATEGCWVKLKYSMKHSMRLGCSELWSELDERKLILWL